jgi:hypothetical protein
MCQAQPYTNSAELSLSQLGLYIRHRQNWRRSSSRTTRRTTHPGIRAYMERREVCVLGQIVCQPANSSCGLSLMATVSFRILITGGTSGLVETITDAVSIHSIKKAEYARRLAAGRLGHVSLFDHFSTVGITEREQWGDVDFGTRLTATRLLLSSLGLSGILQNHLLVCVVSVTRNCHSLNIQATLLSLISFKLRIVITAISFWTERAILFISTSASCCQTLLAISALKLLHSNCRRSISKFLVEWMRSHSRFSDNFSEKALKRHGSIVTD